MFIPVSLCGTTSRSPAHNVLQFLGVLICSVRFEVFPSLFLAFCHIFHTSTFMCPATTVICLILATSFPASTVVVNAVFTVISTVILDCTLSKFSSLNCALSFVSAGDSSRGPILMTPNLCTNYSWTSCIGTLPSAEKNNTSPNMFLGPHSQFETQPLRKLQVTGPPNSRVTFRGLWKQPFYLYNLENSSQEINSCFFFLCGLQSVVPRT